MVLGPVQNPVLAGWLVPSLVVENTHNWHWKWVLLMFSLGEGRGGEGRPEMHMTLHSISFISLAKAAFGYAQSFILDCGRGEGRGFVRNWF